jgi:hypothetical protein
VSEDRDKTATKGVLPFGLVGFAVAFGLWSIWSTSAGPDVNAARRLVGNLEADGSIHNRACGPSRPNRASISRARWELWNLERQEDVMNALATICDAEGAGMEVQLLDLETGAVLALFDGSSVGSESAVEPHDHD